MRPFWLCFALSAISVSACDAEVSAGCRFGDSKAVLTGIFASKPFARIGTSNKNWSDQSRERELPPRKATEVDVRSIARSRTSTNIPVGPRESVKHETEHLRSSSKVYVSNNKHPFNNCPMISGKTLTGCRSLGLQGVSQLDTFWLPVSCSRLKRLDRRVSPQAYLRLGDVLVKMLVVEPPVLQR